jgi:3'-5' exoribonuclease
VPRLPRLAELTPDSAGWGFFLCTSKERRTGRSGSDFLVLTLQDVSAQLTAKILDGAERFDAEFDAGEFVRVEGRGSSYDGRLQLVVSAIRRVHAEQDRLDGFREDECVQSAPRPVGEMWSELSARVAAVGNPQLRVLLLRILADHELQLREWPAAQVIHHAYRGGFLEHIVKMAEVGQFLARAYDADADLVLAGVILHDIGKLQELAYDSGAISYTREGNLVGHIGLGLVLVREAASGVSGFPIELRTQLEHLVLSHHGTREHGSPVEPKTIEAFILAAVDELDARINQVRRAVREDAGDGEFTAWNKRLGRVLYKSLKIEE